MKPWGPHSQAGGCSSDGQRGVERFSSALQSFGGFFSILETHASTGEALGCWMLEKGSKLHLSVEGFTLKVEAEHAVVAGFDDAERSCLCALISAGLTKS